MRLAVAAALAGIALVVAVALLANRAGLAPQSGGGPFSRLSEPRELSELQFLDGAGRVRSLVDFRGKVLLLNVWATWCAPCREEMPALDRLQAALGGSEIEVLALSIDQQGADAVRRFYNEIGIKSLRLYVDPSGRAASVLGAIGVPVTLLVDAGGREIGRHAGPARWDDSRFVEVLKRQALEAAPK